MIDLEKICADVQSIVLDTGKFVKEEAENFDKNTVEYKEFNNLVSYVDKKAEEKLVKKLSRCLPEADFITEEGTATQENKTYTWVIDPLDGTTNFTHGVPLFSISVALYTEGFPILGVVLEVNSGELFYATKGGGAFLNGFPISVSKTSVLKESLVATGFPYYMFDNLDAYFDILKELVQNTHGLRRMGSAAVDLCYVACGRFEGYFEFNLNSYDVGGGGIIVQEAGGIVSNFRGENKDWMEGKEIVAASEEVHTQMIDVIGKYW